MRGWIDSALNRNYRRVHECGIKPLLTSRRNNIESVECGEPGCGRESAWIAFTCAQFHITVSPVIRSWYAAKQIANFIFTMRTSIVVARFACLFLFVIIVPDYTEGKFIIPLTEILKFIQ